MLDTLLKRALEKWKRDEDQSEAIRFAASGLSGLSSPTSLRKPLLPKASRQQKTKKELSLRVLKLRNSEKIAGQDKVQVSTEWHPRITIRRYVGNIWKHPSFLQV